MLFSYRLAIILDDTSCLEGNRGWGLAAQYVLALNLVLSWFSLEGEADASAGSNLRVSATVVVTSPVMSDVDEGAGNRKAGGCVVLILMRPVLPFSKDFLMDFSMRRQ